MHAAEIARPRKHGEPGAAGKQNVRRTMTIRRRSAFRSATMVGH